MVPLSRHNSVSKLKGLPKRWRLPPHLAVVLGLTLLALPLVAFQLGLLQPLLRPFAFTHEGQCEALVNEGSWYRMPDSTCPPELAPSAAACGEGGYTWNWTAAAVGCGAARVETAAARQLLGGRAVVFVGDSVVRLLFGSLIGLLGSDGEERPLVYGHQDFQYSLPGGVDTTFRWAPYPNNVTDLLNHWDSNASAEPFSVVVGVGLWHALHFHDEADWDDLMHALRMAADDFKRLHSDAVLFMVSVSSPVPSKVKTWQKWWHMTPARAARYNAAIERHGLLVPQGGPFHLLDAFPMTRDCGAPCTADGVHYHHVAYDALLQNWANVLRMAGPG